MVTTADPHTDDLRPDLVSTVSGFKSFVESISKKRGRPGVDLNSDDDPRTKRLREEYVPLWHLLRHWGWPQTSFGLGGESDRWDARIEDRAIEVTVALPDREHETRGGRLDKRLFSKEELAEAGDNLEELRRSPWAVRQLHAWDSLQFPQRLVDAVERKLKKGYGDERVLVVSVEDCYSLGDAAVEEEWVRSVRQSCDMDAFSAVYLVIENGLAGGRVLPIKDPVVGQHVWDVDPAFASRTVEIGDNQVTYAACTAIERDRFLGCVPGWPGAHSEAETLGDLDAAMVEVAFALLDLGYGPEGVLEGFGPVSSGTA